MVKADLRVCVDCGCIFNSQIGLRPFVKCPACGSLNRETVEV